MYNQDHVHTIPVWHPAGRIPYQFQLFTRYSQNTIPFRRCVHTICVQCRIRVRFVFLIWSLRHYCWQFLSHVTKIFDFLPKDVIQIPNIIISKMTTEKESQNRQEIGSKTFYMDRWWSIPIIRNIVHEYKANHIHAGFDLHGSRLKQSIYVYIYIYIYRVYKKKVIELQRAIIRELLGVWTIGFLIRKDQAFSYWMACFSCQVEKNKHVRGRLKMLVKITFSPLCLIKTMHNKRKIN
jgi:hypothetical protein